MKISVNQNTVQINDKTYYVIGKIKAKHLVKTERTYGKDIGDVEKSLRLASMLIAESMQRDEASVYAELLEMNSDELQSLMSLMATPGQI